MGRISASTAVRGESPHGMQGQAPSSGEGSIETVTECSFRTRDSGRTTPERMPPDEGRACSPKSKRMLRALPPVSAAPQDSAARRGEASFPVLRGTVSDGPSSERRSLASPPVLPGAVPGLSAVEGVNALCCRCGGPCAVDADTIRQLAREELGLEIAALRNLRLQVDALMAKAEHGASSDEATGSARGSFKRDRTLRRRSRSRETPPSPTLSQGQRHSPPMTGKADGVCVRVCVYVY